MSFNTISQSDLDKAIDQHEKWLKHKRGGKMLKLDNYDLTGRDFSNHNLSHASLQDSIIDDADFTDCSLNDVAFANSRLRRASFHSAECTDCDFENTDCTKCDFTMANLSSAHLENTDCTECDFTMANLSSAHLENTCFFLSSFSQTNLTNAMAHGADFRECDFVNCELEGLHADEDTVGYFLVCPEKGEFTAFKKAELYGGDELVIVELKVPASALRSSACSRKCRVSKAKVVSITSLDGKKKYKQNAYSMYASSFAYKLGSTVEVKNFDKNRWNECSSGIHCFMTRNEAVNY